jgi:hypothetical protein
MSQKSLPEHPAGEAEPLHNGPCVAGDNQATVATPPPRPPDPDEKKRSWLAEFIRTTLDRQTTQIRALLTEALNRSPESESCLQIVAECQKEAATFGNHVLERHALHPAIETVDFLAGLIRQLKEQATSLAAGQTQCPVFQPVLDSIVEMVKIAQTKCEYLDMKVINPQPLDDLDPEKHEIRQVVPTDDDDEHRHVERTLISGLIYRGTVLRRAQVSVYRHAEKS